MFLQTAAPISVFALRADAPVSMRDRSNLGSCNRRQLLLLSAGLLASGTGCGLHFAPLMGPRQISGPLAEGLPNPLLVPLADREFVWNQLVDELDDYFRISREQRVQETGGVLTEGRIETFYTPGATALEPWHRDSTPGFERKQSTLQSIRRRAVARVVPTANGQLIEIQVIKELEDVAQPEQSTVSINTNAAADRYDTSVGRYDSPAIGRRDSLGWICLGRDSGLEQQILHELKARLSHIDQPKTRHHNGPK